MMSSMNERHNLLLPILLMFLFALSRWPGLMPDNFSAAYALAFCAALSSTARATAKRCHGVRPQ